MQAYILRMNGNKNSQSSAPSRSIRGESMMGMSLGEKGNKPDPKAVVTTNLSEITIEVKKQENL